LVYAAPEGVFLWAAGRDGFPHERPGNISSADGCKSAKGERDWASSGKVVRLVSAELARSFVCPWGYL